MPPRVDFAIVGQGLAGTALAWHLLRRGRSVRVFDRARGDSASRVAAGLITPVTGKRLAKSWRWDELFPAAAAFYRSVEAETGASFFRQKSALRLFASEAERDEFRRREGGILRGLVRAEPPIRSEWFAAPFGGFEMPSAARLDVPRFLDASRDHFRARGMYAAAHVKPIDGVASSLTSPLAGEVAALQCGGWGVRFHASPHPPPAGAEDGSGDLPRKRGGEEAGGFAALLREAETVVLCRGYSPEPDPWFGGVRFNAAKGEILTVRIPGLAEERVVHRGVWLVPAVGEVFHVGATHTWDPLDAVPTAEGRAEIEAKLRAFLKLPYEVISHRAAVRPVIDAGFPALGRHPANPRLAYFNGLGAKGSLLAPFFADQLAAHLCGEGEIDDAVSVRRHLK